MKHRHIFFILAFLVLHVNSQTSFLLTAGFNKPTWNHIKKRSGSSFTTDRTQGYPSLSFGAGLALDTLKIRKLKLYPVVFIGMDAWAQGIWGDWPISAESYEFYLYSRFTPRVFLNKHIYIGPMFDFSYRTRYNLLDEPNKDLLVYYGVLDSISRKPLIKAYHFRIGPEFGVEFRKIGLLFSLQFSWGLFTPIYLKHLNYDKYYIKDFGWFLTYRFPEFKKHRKL